jgi:hypothetical protein
MYIQKEMQSEFTQEKLAGEHSVSAVTGAGPGRLNPTRRQGRAAHPTLTRTRTQSQGGRQLFPPRTARAATRHAPQRRVRSIQDGPEPHGDRLTPSPFGSCLFLCLMAPLPFGWGVASNEATRVEGIDNLI